MPFEPTDPADPADPAVCAAPPAAPRRSWVPRWAAAGLLLVIGTGTSLWAWQKSADVLARGADVEFDRYSQLSFENIDQRVQHQLDLLAGFQALFRASSDVSRAEFHRLFEDMQVKSRFPGVQAVHFSRLVDGSQRAAYEAGVRQDRTLRPEGYPGFTVHPPGLRPDYLPVEFNEPMGGDETVFGYDIAAEPIRREVLARARDSGQPQASAPLILLRQRSGVVVRLPVYRRGAPHATVAQRRAALVGVVSAVLRVDEMLRDTLPAQRQAPYQVTVSDQGLIGQPDAGKAGAAGPAGQAPAPAGPAVTTLVTRQRFDTAAQPDAGPPRPEDRRAQALAMAGRAWVIEVARQPVNHARAVFPLLVLGSGLAITLLLALVAGRLSRQQQRIQRLALAMSAQARANAERLHAVFNSTADAIITTDRHGNMLSVNQAAQRIFGHPAERMEGHSLSLLMPLGGAARHSQWLEKAGAPLAEDAARGQAPRTDVAGGPATPDAPAAPQRLLQARRADGTLFPIELRVSQMVVDGQRQFVGLLRDLTEAQAASDRIAASAQALQAANALREAVFEHAAFALIVTDAQGLVQAMNPAAERLLDCRAADEVGRSTLGSFLRGADLDTLRHMLDQHQQVAAAARQAVGGGTAGALPSHQRSIERSLHCRRRDGGRVPVAVTLSALHDGAGAINGYLAIVCDITERQRLAEQLSHLAYHDGLTGLPNRTRLEDQLQQAIAQARRSGAPLALLFIDLDRFKPINDQHGHAVGDQVLCEVARRLQQGLRSSDMAARLGGDEFVVLLSTLARADDCLLVADKLLRCLAEPMRVGGHDLQVGASIGVAHYPESGADAAALLRSADAAMYQAKLAGRSTLRLAGRAATARHG